MTIKKLPSTERPYEKAQMYGIENLSNSELLAIIIKTGTKEKTSVQLAQEILSIESKNKENIQFLQDISLEELTKIKGIGIVKAIQIKAVCEMAKRISKPLNANKVQIRSSASVANLLMNEMKYEKREKVSLNISIKDDKGNPVNGSFSVSITDRRSIQPDSLADNILSNLLLTS